MKKLQTLLAIAMSGVLMNVSLSAFGQSTKAGFATVVRVRGAASYSLDGGATTFPLVPGKYLSTGASIITGSDGVVDLVLDKVINMPEAVWTPSRISLSPDSPVRGYVADRPARDQNAIRVNENSKLVIDKLSASVSGVDAVNDTELDLKNGSIYASVKKLSPAAQYLIKTPTGIAGVRGTELSLSLNDDGSIRNVAVYRTMNDDGLVLAVTPPSGVTQTFLIKDGEMWTPGETAPVPIPPQIRAVLQTVFAGLRTHFLQLVTYVYDRTQVLESSDFGSSF